MNGNHKMQVMLDAVEEAMRGYVARVADRPSATELQGMLAYALGWDEIMDVEKARGKRIRPVMLLLAAEAAGGDWRKAVPAAAAVELLHNFTLIHDDIQDSGYLRRGRPSVWHRWDVARAINAGDLMFVLANLAALDLERTLSAEQALAATRLLLTACIRLTQGQHLDLTYEQRNGLGMDEYWEMVEGKTASLLAVAMQLGALTADASPETQTLYYEFGRSLGLAYQVKDDLLGVWGDAGITGKSNESDLTSGKKSLPVVYAMGRASRPGVVQPLAVVDALELAGAREYTQQQAERLTRAALTALEQAAPRGEAGKLLFGIASSLLEREN